MRKAELSYHAVREVQRSVQQRIGEDGDRVAPKLVGSTAGPAAELVVRHRHVIAHSRVLGMPTKLACPRERAFCAPWAQRAGQSQADSRVLLRFSLFVYPTRTFVATVEDGLQRSADQTDPSPPEPHRRPS
jgi:hypothetical protein